MDGARNLLLGTCKERNLRKIDPNIDDKFLSFKTTNMDEYGIKPGDRITTWKPLQSDSHYAFITPSDIAPTRNVTTGLVAEFTPGTYLKGQAHPVFQMNEPGQTEFYFRTSLWSQTDKVGKAKVGDQRLIFGVKDGDIYNMSLYVQWVSLNEVIFTFNWFGESGEAKSLSSAPYKDTGWPSVRVFIREDSVALQRDRFEVKVPFTGVRKASSTATIELYKSIGDIDTQTNVRNIGFGGFIADAPPEPVVG